MLILFNLHIFAAVIVLYSDFCEFSLLYRGDLLYRGTLPQHLIQKLLIGRILLSVPDILHINPGSLYIGMPERLRYDRHVHRGQVWRATYEESGLSTPASFPRVFSVLL